MLEDGPTVQLPTGIVPIDGAGIVPWSVEALPQDSSYRHLSSHIYAFVVVMPVTRQPYTNPDVWFSSFRFLVVLASASA